MSRDKHGKAASWVQQYPMNYLGGEALTSGGLANIPSKANAFSIAAETGPVYYAINAPTVTTDSPGYCPDGAVRLEGPIGNLSQLAVLPSGGGIAHIQYWAI